MRIKAEMIRFGRVGGNNCRFTHFDPKTNSWWTDDLKTKTDDGNVVWGMWVKADIIKWEE